MRDYRGPLDALLVLGRGIDKTGQLSQTSEDRAKYALHIAQDTMPSVIVFSGGHSWAQEQQHIEFPSEGRAMLACAMKYLAWADMNIPEGTELKAEEHSLSTVENMVNSKPLLEINPGDTLGILSDDLHFSQGRIDYLAKLVFPKVVIKTYDITLMDYPSGAEAEEKLATHMTKLFMTGVHPGNGRAIMRRQRLLEHANLAYRRIHK